MEMRLGKSWVALLFALMFSKGRILILCPSKPIVSWLHECQLNSVEPLVFVGTKAKKIKLLSQLSKYRVVISTYSSAIKYGLLKDEAGFDIKILDETYKLSKASSERSGYLCNNRGTSFNIGLSGNPGAETPLDLVPQYIAVDGNIGPYTTVWDFYKDNCQLSPFKTYELKPGQDEQIRTWMRNNSFCMTRKEAGVGGGKEYGRIFCELPEEARTLYNGIVEDTIFKKTWEFGGKQVKLDALTRANVLWRLTSGILPSTDAKVEYTHKLKAVAKWMIDNNQRKVVILANFIDECRKMHKELQAVGIRSAWMDGSTTMKKQLGIQEKFNSNEIEAVVLEERAFAMGLNFSAADVIIYVSNSLAGDDRTQSEDRIIHLDKRYDVWVYDVCCRGGADGYIADMVHTKRDVAYELMAQGARCFKEIEKWTETD